MPNFDLLETQIRVSQKDEKVIRADERQKTTDKCICAFNELATKWITDGNISLGDIPRLAEELKQVI